MIPLIGASQSGKSALFHELLQKDGSTRVGNGVESKTGLCVRQPSFIGEYSLIDTPGLNQTQGGLTNALVEYQLSELMVSGQFPTVVVTLTEKDFLPPFTTNGIRTLMMFFDRFFDLRKMGNGFYESIFNDHFNTEGYSEIVERLNAPQALDAQPGEHDGLVDAAKAEVQETWNAGLGKIAAAIEAMPTTPFTVFVRDNESDLDEEDQLTLKKLERKIARGIKHLKENIVEQVLINHGIMNPETDDLMGCLIYLLTIKKSAEVTNSIDSESKKTRVQLRVEEVPFNFEDIKIEDYDIDYTFITQLSGMIQTLNQQISDRTRLSEGIKSTLSNIDSTEAHIASLKMNGDLEQAETIRKLDADNENIKAWIRYYDYLKTHADTELRAINTDGLVKIKSETKSLSFSIVSIFIKRYEFETKMPYDDYSVSYKYNKSKRRVDGSMTTHEGIPEKVLEITEMPKKFIQKTEGKISIFPLPEGCAEVTLTLWQKKQDYFKDYLDNLRKYIEFYEGQIQDLNETLKVNIERIKHLKGESTKGSIDTKELIDKENKRLLGLKDELKSRIKQCSEVSIDYADTNFVYDCLDNQSFKYLQQLFSKFYGPDVKSMFKESFQAFYMGESRHTLSAQPPHTRRPQRADGADDPGYQQMPSRANVLAAQQVYVGPAQGAQERRTHVPQRADGADDQVYQQRLYMQKSPML